MSLLYEGLKVAINMYMKKLFSYRHPLIINKSNVSSRYSQKMNSLPPHPLLFPPRPPNQP